MERMRRVALGALSAMLIGAIFAPVAGRAAGSRPVGPGTVAYVGPMHLPRGTPFISGMNTSLKVQSVSDTAYDQNGTNLGGGSVGLAPGGIFSDSWYPSPPDTVLWAVIRGDAGSVSGSLQVKGRDRAPTRLLLEEAPVLGGAHQTGIGGPVYNLGTDRGIYVNVANVGASTTMAKVRLITGGGQVQDDDILSIDPLHIATWSPDTSGWQGQFSVEVTVGVDASVIASYEEYVIGNGRIAVVAQIS
jgi:hypothetical protein